MTCAPNPVFHNGTYGQAPSQVSLEHFPFPQNEVAIFSKSNLKSTNLIASPDALFQAPDISVAPGKVSLAQAILAPQSPTSSGDSTGTFVTTPNQTENLLQMTAKSDPVLITVDLLSPSFAGIEFGIFEPLLSGSNPENSVVSAKTPTADIAPRLIQAITDAATNLKDRPIELSFSPEELGRVRLTLHHNDGNMLVTVSAERPETQDLLRRHIEILANQLREVGYQSVNFEFSEKHNSFANHTAPETEESVDQPLDFEPEQPSQIRRIDRTNPGRIDIRL